MRRANRAALSPWRRQPQPAQRPGWPAPAQTIARQGGCDSFFGSRLSAARSSRRRARTGSNKRRYPAIPCMRRNFALRSRSINGPCFFRLTRVSMRWRRIRAQASTAPVRCCELTARADVTRKRRLRQISSAKQCRLRPSAYENWTWTFSRSPFFGLFIAPEWARHPRAAHHSSASVSKDQEKTGGARG